MDKKKINPKERFMGKIEDVIINKNPEPKQTKKTKNPR